jgi:hypothetical protein
LNKKIDAKQKRITLVFGGKEILAEEITQLKGELKKYNLPAGSLEIKQGFAYLSDNKNNEQNQQVSELIKALAITEANKNNLAFKIDSIKKQDLLHAQILAEIKAQYPLVKNGIIQPSVAIGDSTAGERTVIILLKSSANLPASAKRKLENWLKLRLNQSNINLFFQ